MARRTDVAAERATLTHPNRATGRPQPPPAPRWMAWVPRAAVVWALAYGPARVWWRSVTPPRSRRLAPT
jgi:hypothetical protein